jgi:hypothetical protein
VLLLCEARQVKPTPTHLTQRLAYALLFFLHVTRTVCTNNYISPAAFPFENLICLTDAANSHHLHTIQPIWTTPGWLVIPPSHIFFFMV